MCHLKEIQFSRSDGHVPFDDYLRIVVVDINVPRRSLCHVRDLERRGRFEFLWGKCHVHVKYSDLGFRLRLFLIIPLTIDTQYNIDDL